MKHETTVLHDSVLYRLIFKLGNLSIMFELYLKDQWIEQFDWWLKLYDISKTLVHIYVYYVI